MGECRPTDLECGKGCVGVEYIRQVRDWAADGRRPILVPRAWRLWDVPCASPPKKGVRDRVRVRVRIRIRIRVSRQRPCRCLP
eukprot:scaffold18892_cov183-Isochrysis_galbana.AAC.5